MEAFACGHPKEEGNITRWRDRTYCRTCQATRSRGYYARHRDRILTRRQPRPKVIPKVIADFACGHPRDLWNTVTRAVPPNGRIRQECRECKRDRAKALVVSGANRERMRRRNVAQGKQLRPDLWEVSGPWPKDLPRRVGLCRCGGVRIAGVAHRCVVSEANWNGILCPACGIFKGERRMKEALCSEHGSINAFYYRRDPVTWQKVIDASKHRIHLKRAAQERGEVITIAALIERDGDCCYLCARQVSDALPFTHPLKANIEHVVPISRGGTHTLANVRVACRSCNSAKGAKVAA